MYDSQAERDVRMWECAAGGLARLGRAWDVGREKAPNADPQALAHGATSRAENVGAVRFGEGAFSISSDLSARGRCGLAAGTG